MVFDSHYDEFRGAITYVRIMNGCVRKGQKIRFLRGGTTHDVLEVGQFTPRQRPCEQLQAGQVGYLICNIKSLDFVHIGDTVTVPGEAAAPALPGYQHPARMVYCGLYPSDGQDFSELREALERLSINDPSFEFEPETSDALGFRVPLWVSGLAAHGDHSAAAGAGGGCRSGPDRSECDLPG